MPDISPLVQSFLKTYQNAKFLYTTLVRHQGTVIGFALDDQTRIHYTVLDFSPPPGTQETAPPPVSDVAGWNSTPDLLLFPPEVARTGFGAVGLTAMPVLKLNAAAPEPPSAVLPTGDRAAPTVYDYFNSTTARLTAPGQPFQVLSDGNFVYVFRQSIPGDAAARITPTAGKFVDSNLLLDRFILAGRKLLNKNEVRFVRSRSKTRPQSRKDSLGPKDLEGNPFLEPTQSLNFIGALTEGRFAALLLPTAAATVERWQIFAQNAFTGRMDCYNIERAEDGLFNTRGSTPPEDPEDAARRGHAESALRFSGQTRLALDQAISLTRSVQRNGQDVTLNDFTIEAWVNPAGGVDPQVVFAAEGGGSILTLTGSTLKLRFSDGTEVTSPPLGAANTWQHVALTFDSAGKVRFFLEGRLQQRPEQSFAGKTVAAIKNIGAANGGFQGIVDELRVWNRARSARELEADKNERLTGLEPGLIAYYRFDEAGGRKVFDQTRGTAHATISGVPDWVVSGAPLVESPGIERQSFAIDFRNFNSAPSALLYFQQSSEVPSGYTGEKKPLKQNARVMFAVATRSAITPAPTGEQPFIAILDFAVSSSGRLTKIHDDVVLSTVVPRASVAENGSVNDALDRMAGLEARIRGLEAELIDFDNASAGFNNVIKTLDAAMGSDPAKFPDALPGPDFKDLNELVRSRRASSARLTAAFARNGEVRRNFQGAKVTFFADNDFSGASLEVALISNSRPGFGAALNDKISSVKITRADGSQLDDGTVAFALFENTGLGGRRKDFTASVGNLGDFNDIASDYILFEGPAFAAARAEIDAAQAADNAAVAALSAEKERRIAANSNVTTQRTAKESALAAARTELTALDNAVRGAARAPMALLEPRADPSGLTIAGGLLSFAFSNHRPLLADSATGDIALYFRGSSNQFFCAYYNTFTTRARYPLGSVTLVARSNEVEMDRLQVEVTSSDTGELCTVKVSGAGIEEIWRRVPRNPGLFAGVINGGRANRRVRVGEARFGPDRSSLVISSPGLNRAVPSGAVLLLGNVKVAAKDAALQNATTITLTAETLNPPVEARPLFLLPYDYEANATSTQLTADLENGSSLVIASASANDSTAVSNRFATSGTTLSSAWIANAPGTMLEFDGAARFASLQSAAGLSRLDAPDDMTIEAWVLPSRVHTPASIIEQKRTSSDTSTYSLSIEPSELRSALRLGPRRFVSFSQFSGGPLTADFTAEALVKIDSAGKFFNPPPMVSAGTGDAGFRIQYNPSDGSVSGVVHTLEVKSSLTLKDGAFHHIAFVKKGAQISLFVDGTHQETKSGAPAAISVALTTLRFGSEDDAFAGRAPFSGDLDEVRLWDRARNPQEIANNRSRRLSGNESGLLGAWSFEKTSATDVSPKKNHGVINNGAGNAPNPLTPYRLRAEVRGRASIAQTVLPAGTWTHVAAVCRRGYAVQFSGGESYLDLGTKDNLSLPGDLTLEVALTLDRLNTPQVILRKGSFAGSETPPYALLVGADNIPVFAFKDVDRKLQQLAATKPLTAGHHKLTVTRKREEETDADPNSRSGKSFFDRISFFVDGVAAGEAKYEGVKLPTDEDRPKRTENIRKPPDVGTSNGALVVARGDELAFTRFESLKGIVAEVRIWNRARPESVLSARIAGTEDGLLARWMFTERDGVAVRDSRGDSHGTLHSAAWVHSPSAADSDLIIYINGQKQTDDLTAVDSAAKSDQFTLAARQTAAAGAKDRFFAGSLEEVRLWRTARTEEQIQDNLFNRVRAELEDLIAYYPFDPPKDSTRTTDATLVRDQSLSLNDLTAVDPRVVLSTAPIGDDGPLVRSALAGVQNPFAGFIHSAPAVQEYGDAQFDADGNLIGVLKRCYGYTLDNEWHLVTGYKVGDLATEWVGQVQFAPQLQGYIEGAPPVPSENLTRSSDIALGDLDDYNEASTVSFEQASQTTLEFSATRDAGVKLGVDFGFRAGPAAEQDLALPGVNTKLLKVKALAGPKIKIETAHGFLDEARISRSLTIAKATSLELRGRFATDRELEKRRFPDGSLPSRNFVPDNLGIALVKSKTADVFALRLRHNGALIAYQIRPNPDIPEDFNLIPFQISPTYTKQGVLDGKVGSFADSSFPNAFSLSSDVSYFKPKEAYALKDKIEKRQRDLEARFNQHDAARRAHLSQLAAGSLLSKLEEVALSAEERPLQLPTRRNLSNTYVWTADGGLFAETQNALDVWTEATGGSFEFTGGLGADFKAEFQVATSKFEIEYSLLLSGYYKLTEKKSRESQSSFGLTVALDKVERDIYEIRKVDRREEVVLDELGRPVREPGKVDAYRFMTFLLEPSNENFDDFFSKVVDPQWLQTNDPNAVALREARDAKTRPPCWRVLHRVTFVSRVLEKADGKPKSSLERALISLDIDSNFELIRQFQPYVQDHVGDVHDFVKAIEDKVNDDLPELAAHLDEITKFLMQFFNVSEGLRIAPPSEDEEALGEASLSGPGVNLPPTVSIAGDETRVINMEGSEISLPLQAVVSDDRLDLDAIFITWEQTAGPAPVTFAPNTHALSVSPRFTQRGTYRIRVTADDGSLTATHEVAILVNTPPAVAITAGDVRKDGEVWKVDLQGELSSGLADEDNGRISVKWRRTGSGPDVSFDPPADALQTAATFRERGVYILELEADNGVRRSAQVLLNVGVRTTAGLEALYTFQGGKAAINDVSLSERPIRLTAANPALVDDVRLENQLAGVRLTGATQVASSDTAAVNRLVRAIQQTNQLTIEAWIAPASTSVSGLARIVTLSAGPSQRNFILGQSGSAFHIGLRTAAGDPVEDNRPAVLNASDKALAVGAAVAGRLTHVIATFGGGVCKLYVDGREVARRPVRGTFANWALGHILALGNEVGTADGIDRSWLGEYHLLAIYSRALDAVEVEDNHAWTANRPSPALVSAAAESTPGSLTVNLRGRTVDAGGRPVPARWSLVQGPVDVSISSPAALATTATVPAPGDYRFRLTATDEGRTSIAEAAVTVHAAPRFRIDAPRNVGLTGGPALVTLSAALSDSGAANPSELTFLWSQTAGPAVEIPNRNAPSTNVSIPAAGVYVFSLQVRNSRAAATEIVIVTANRAPRVSILPGQEDLTTLPQTTLRLLGRLEEKGTGDPQVEPLVRWTSVPDGVTFAPPNSAECTATFPSGGVYTLSLEASIPGNPELAHTLRQRVTVNQAPQVNAGPPRTVDSETLPVQIVLDATVSDDGLPEDPGRVEVLWIDPANTVTFGTPASDITTARFPRKGKFALQVQAQDSPRTAPVTSQVEINVNTAPSAAIQAPSLIRVNSPVTLSADIDDGLAEPGAVTVRWSAAGPSPVSFTTPNARSTQALFDREGAFTVSVALDNGKFSKTISRQLTVGSRVTQGLIAQFDFRQDQPGRVSARAGSAAGMTLIIADPSSATFLPGGGMRVDPATILLSPQGPNPISRAINTSRALTFELLVEPSTTGRAVAGASILTISSDGGERNFTLRQDSSDGRDADIYSARIRSEGNPADASVFSTAAATVTANRPQHVVCTRSETGRVTIYLNGTEVLSAAGPGGPPNWDESLGLILANEPNRQRGWLGIYRLLAIYNRALSAAEVRANFDGLDLAEAAAV